MSLIWALFDSNEMFEHFRYEYFIYDSEYLNIDFIGVWQLDSGKLVTMALFNWSQTLRNNWNN